MKTKKPELMEEEPVMYSRIIVEGFVKKKKDGSRALLANKGIKILTVEEIKKQ